MFRRLSAFVELDQTRGFAPRLDLFGHQPVAARRTLIAWAVRMEFRHHNQRARAKQASNVAKNACWILGMMQDHGEQRRIRAQACWFERRGIDGKSLNVRATTFLLQAFQVGKSFDRTVYCVDCARGPDPIGEHQGHDGPDPTSSTRSSFLRRKDSIHSPTRPARVTWRAYTSSQVRWLRSFRKASCIAPISQAKPQNRPSPDCRGDGN